MTYGLLYAAKETLGKMGSVEFKSGLTALKMKRFLVEYFEKVQPFEEVRSEGFKKFGEEKDGKISISPESEKWDEFVDYINEAGSEEVEWDVEPFLSTDDLIQIEGLTVRDISALEELGVIDA